MPHVALTLAESANGRRRGKPGGDVSLHGPSRLEQRTKLQGVAAEARRLLTEAAG